MQYVLILFTPGSPLPLPLGVSQHGPLHLLILSYCFLCSSPLFFFVTQQVQLMLPAGTLSADDNLTLSRSRAGNYSYSELLSRHVQKTALHGTLLHPLAFPFLSFPLPWCLLSSRGDDVLPRAEHSQSFILNTYPVATLTAEGNFSGQG